MYYAITTSIFSALIGTFLGSYGVYRLNENKNKKIRNICKNALKIIKKHGKYCSAKSDFNSEVNISEKRAILVCLHKLGIPIEFPINSKLNIYDIGFLDKEIKQKEIQLMIAQVNSGICDAYFFIDIDSYFNDNENMRINTIRSIAKRYVDEVIEKSILNEKGDQFILPGLNERFSLGEINAIGVFIQKNKIFDYYDKDNKQINTNLLNKLRSDIDSGVWDMYLQWDMSAYENLLIQKQMAENINNNLTTDHKTQ